MPNHVDAPQSPTPATDAGWHVVAPRRQAGAGTGPSVRALGNARPRRQVSQCDFTPPAAPAGPSLPAQGTAAWLNALPRPPGAPAPQPTPPAPGQVEKSLVGRLDFGPPPASWSQLRSLTPRVISEAVKRLQREGRGSEAKALAHAALQRHPRDAHLWAQLLQACRDELGTIEALRARMLQTNVRFDTYHDAALLDAAGRVGDVARAQHFAEAARLDGRQLNISGYNALMLAHVRANRADDAFAVLDEMVEHGVEPNEVTPSYLATAARGARRVDLLLRVVQALEVGELWADAPGYNAVATAARDVDAPDLLGRAFEAVRAAGLQPSVAMYNVSIDLHARRGEPQAAQRAYVALLAAQQRPTEMTFLALLGALRAGQDVGAIDATLAEMRDYGLTADVRHLSAALQGHGAAQNIVGVRATWAKMRANRRMPDAQGFAVVLTALGQCNAEQEAWATYRELRALGCRPNDVVLNVIADCLARRRRGAEGETLLAEMRAHRWACGEQAYTQLIDLFGRTERQACIPRVFAAMAEAGVHAPETTYTAVVAAAGARGDLAAVHAAVAAAQAAGHKPSPRMVIALCHAFHRAGRRNPSHYAAGARLLRGLELPLEALPDAADLLRKARAREEARGLCRRVLDALPQHHPAHQHAWIIDIYCADHADAGARLALKHPPFGPESPHWVRYLCATIFRDAVELPAAELQKTLSAAHTEARNEGSLEDINQALLALCRRRKPD